MQTQVNSRYIGKSLIEVDFRVILITFSVEIAKEAEKATHRDCREICGLRQIWTVSSLKPPNNGATANPVSRGSHSPQYRGLLPHLHLRLQPASEHLRQLHRLPSLQAELQWLFHWLLLLCYCPQRVGAVAVYLYCFADFDLPMLC